MSRMQPLTRVVFREAVDYPGDHSDRPLVVMSPESRFPLGQQVRDLVPRPGSKEPPPEPKFRAYFSDGFVVIENTRSKNRVHVPMSNVKSMAFELAEKSP